MPNAAWTRWALPSRNAQREGVQNSSGRGGGPCSVLGASSLGSTPGCQAGSELLPPQNRGERETCSVSGLPPSCLMPLQCFPPPCIARKWPEASSFCAVGCWPAPWARCQSRQAELSQPGRPKGASTGWLRWDAFWTPPSPSRAGRETISSCRGALQASGAAREQNQGALPTAWPQGLSLLRGWPGRFPDKYRHHLKG